MATPNKMALVDRLFDALAGREGCIINDTSWAVVVVYETKVEGDSKDLTTKAKSQESLE